MAWEDLPTTLDTRGGHIDPRVTLALRKESKTAELCLIASINKALTSALRWDKGQRVKPQIDRARGLVRIVRAPQGAATRMTETGGMTVRLLIPELAQVTRPAEVIPHERAGDTLLLTLPDWARPAQGRALPLAQPAMPLAEAATLAESAPSAAAAPEPEADAQAPLWTDDRRSLPRQMWPKVELISLKGLRQQINDLPGHPLSGDTQMYAEVKKLGLPTSRMTAAEEAREESARQAREPAVPVPAPPAPAPAAPPPPIVAPAAPAVLGHAATLKASPHAPGRGAVISAADQDRRLRDEVAECLAAGMGARAIKDEMGIGLDEVLKHKAAIEAEQRAAARAAATAAGSATA